MLETQQAQARERAQIAAQQTANEAKEEFGRMAFEILEEYFPEQARGRRREDRLMALAAGIAVGFVLRHLVGR